MKNTTPLFVDLDGSLIKSDLLYESVFYLLKNNPLYIFWLPLWLLKGKAHLKHKIASSTSINASLLPYNEALLEFLKKQHSSGRSLILATASNIKFAREIADYLGIFTDVIASDEKTNLSGTAKLKKIQQFVDNRDFSYVGNSAIDLKIFKHASTAILANPDKGLSNKTSKLTTIEATFDCKKNQFTTALKAMRIHQWVKNILVFIPLLTAQLWYQLDNFLLCVFAFFVFGLTASSVYLLNDLLDLDADRLHPRKRLRPFASGDLSLIIGIGLIFLLPLITFTAAYLISPDFFYVLVLYFLTTVAYSFYLKSFVLIDVIILAGLYTIRVVAGAVILSAPPSFWLLAFSMFIFTSLALVKRASELYTLKEMNTPSTKGRDYNVSDLPILQGMGLASGYTSILVIALFINSPEVVSRYSRPEALWLLCPCLLYWISRIWLKTQRNQMHDDPIVFSIKDRGSRFIALCMAVIVLVAI